MAPSYLIRIIPAKEEREFFNGYSSAERGHFARTVPRFKKSTRRVPTEHPVPFRAIALTNGEIHTVYDTSGPFTDPDVAIDVRAGIAPLRSADRRTQRHGRTGEAVVGVSHRPRIDGRTRRYRFKSQRLAPREAGANVTQMHTRARASSRRDEYIAIRENCEPSFVRDEVARGPP